MELRIKKQELREEFIKAVTFFKSIYENDKSQMVQQARKYKEKIPYVLKISMLAENEQRFFFKLLKKKMDEDLEALRLKLGQGKSFPKEKTELLKSDGQFTAAKCLVKDIGDKNANFLEKSVTGLLNQLLVAKEIVHWDSMFMFLASQKVLKKSFFAQSKSYIDQEIKQEDELLPL